MKTALRMTAAMVVVVMVLAGCVDDFASPTEIRSNRVLGARVEVAGDPARAWPKAGEDVVVRWFVVDPAEAAPLSWAFLLCEAGPAEATTAICGAGPFATEVQAIPTTDAPTVTFTVPKKAKRILMQGVICANGTPVVDQTKLSVSCRSTPDTGAEPAMTKATLVTKTIVVATDETGDNHNPASLADAEIQLRRAEGDVPVSLAAEGAVPTENCDEASDIPVFANGKHMELLLPLAQTDRETYKDADGTERKEVLELATFATAGKWNRAFSIVDDDYEGDRSLYWDGPKAKDVAEGGQRVRFHFVLRDARGGEQWTTRELCVVP